MASKLLSSKWHEDLTKRIDLILSEELEKISEALNTCKNANDLPLLWHHFDRLHAMQALNDGRYTSNNPKLNEKTIITIKD